MLYKYQLIKPYSISVRWSLCNWREWVLWLTSLLLTVKSYLWLTQSATSTADVLLLCLEIRAVWDAAVLVPPLQGFIFPCNLLHCPLFFHPLFPMSSAKCTQWPCLLWDIPPYAIFSRQNLTQIHVCRLFLCSSLNKMCVEITSASQGMAVGRAAVRFCSPFSVLLGLDLKANWGASFLQGV